MGFVGRLVGFFGVFFFFFFEALVNCLCQMVHDCKKHDHIFCPAAGLPHSGGQVVDKFSHVVFLG